MAEFVISKTVAARPETVFDLFTDHRNYAEITPIRSSELEREGDPPPNGVGAIRALRLVGPPIREEMTGYDRPTHFSYRMLSGVPVREYDATVNLAPVDRGTALSYRVTVTPAIPALGFAVGWAIGAGLRVLLRGLVSEAERRG
jgi:Polyketide cyclase / dehydrase and lipid transport